MKKLLLPASLLLAATLSAQTAAPDTSQRITSTAGSGVSYDLGVAGSDGSFSVTKVGVGQRLAIDANGNVYIPASLVTAALNSSGALALAAGGANQNITLTPSGSGNVVLNGNVNIPQNLTVTGSFSAGSFAGTSLAGGSSGLTLTAGGTNQNITLTPSGSGSTVLNGGVSVPQSLSVTGLATVGSLSTANLAGSASGLALAAGGSNQSITLTPTGSGNIILNGNVGIGTSAPQSPLDVLGTVAIKSDQVGANGALNALRWLNSTSSNYEVASIKGYRINADDEAGLIFSTKLTGSGSNTERMRLTSAGNLGLGTSTPTARLDVSGGANVSGNLGVGTTNPGAQLDVAQNARVQGDLYVGGQIHITTGNVVADNVSNSLQVTSTTDSTGYATGALIVNGGTGIAKNLNVGANANVNGTVTANLVDTAQLKIAGTAFNPATYVQQTGGVVNGNLAANSFSGSSSGLNINAGGAGKSITLNSDDSGRVEVRDILAVTDPATPGTPQYLLMGNQDRTGANNPVIFQSYNGSLYLGHGNSWNGAGGTFTAALVLSNSGYLGIGTLTPGNPLDIAAAAGPRIGLTETGSGIGGNIRAGSAATNTIDGVQIVSSKGFSVSTNGQTNKFVIDPNGNVGIGTTVPAHALEVSSAWGTQMALGGVGRSGRLDFIRGNDGTTANTYIGYAGASEAANFTVNASGGGSFLTFGTANTERVRIDTTGNVGIGTTTPGSKLQVAAGDITIDNGTAIRSGNDALIGNNGSNLITVGSANVSHALALNAGGADRLHILPSGSIGIGTSAPTAQLTVANDAAIGTNASIGGDLSLTGSQTIGGSLIVGGPTGLYNSLLVHGAESVDGLITAGSSHVFGASVVDGMVTAGLGVNNVNQRSLNLADPADPTDAANKRYVDNTQPWNWNTTLGNLSLKHQNDRVLIGYTPTYAPFGPEAPLHIENNTFDGEVAAFSPGGPNRNLNLRSYVKLASQDPSHYWEFSVQDEVGSGTEAGFALRARDPREDISKPRFYVSPAAPVTADAPRSFFRFYNQNVSDAWDMSVQGPAGDGNGNSLAFYEWNIATGYPNGVALYLENGTGNVGIGTTNPAGYKLAVRGSIHASEVVVDTNWADYVFSPTYRLAPLSEVEKAIKQDGHLPGIPSATEVAKTGVSMGDMQAKLLAKVEELTLHLIDQEKRIDKFEAENTALRHEASAGGGGE